MKYLQVCAAAHEPLIKARMRLGQARGWGVAEENSNKKAGMSRLF